MGALPKRKISKGRKNRRRSHNSLKDRILNASSVDTIFLKEIESPIYMYHLPNILNFLIS